jgi:hypothetical protein
MKSMIKQGMNNKQMSKIAHGKNDNDADDKKPLKKPLIKPSHKGLLHTKLGVAQGKKIPAAKINKALHSKSPALRKEANFAKNFGK